MPKIKVEDRIVDVEYYKRGRKLLRRFLLESGNYTKYYPVIENEHTK